MRSKIIWKEVVKTLCTRQMKYKKEIVFCAVIGDYLLERQKGRSLLDAVHNTKFSISDQMITHKVLINYFKLM